MLSKTLRRHEVFGGPTQWGAPFDNAQDKFRPGRNAF